MEFEKGNKEPIRSNTTPEYQKRKMQTMFGDRSQLVDKDGNIRGPIKKQDGTGPNKEGRGGKCEQNKQIKSKGGEECFMSTKEINSLKDFINMIRGSEMYPMGYRNAGLNIPDVDFSMMKGAEEKEKNSKYKKEYYSTFKGENIVVDYIHPIDGMITVTPSKGKLSEGEQVMVLVRGIASLLKKSSPEHAVDEDELVDQLLEVVVDHMTEKFIDNVFDEDDEDEEYWEMDDEEMQLAAFFDVMLGLFND